MLFIIQINMETPKASKLGKVLKSSHLNWLIITAFWWLQFQDQNEHRKWKKNVSELQEASAKYMVFFQLGKHT